MTNPIFPTRTEVKPPRRKFSKKNAGLLLSGALIVLACIGAVQAVQEVNQARRDREVESSVAPLPSPSPSYNLTMKGEDGFWEYQRSVNFHGSRTTALEAGYLTCKLLDVSNPLDTYNQLRFAEKATETDAQRLLVSSTTYLCTSHLQEVKDFSRKGTAPWVTSFPL